MPLVLLNIDDNDSISNWSLFYLAKMPKLESLSVASTAITDDGLRYIAASCSIGALFLGGNQQLTAKAIQNLKPDTSHLDILFLNGCNFGDDSAEDIAKFRFLNSVNFAGNRRVSDRMIQALANQNKNYIYLSFADDHVTENGIKALAQFKKLKVLDLSGVRLNGKAVNYLAQMKHLEALYVVECGLTANDLQKLEKALPKTRIERVSRRNYRLELSINCDAVAPLCSASSNKIFIGSRRDLG